MKTPKKRTNSPEPAESPENTGHALGNRVIELRKKHKLTLDQLASTSGVSRSMLSQIERGQANPTLTVTFRIAQAFGMSIGELVDQPWTSSTIEVVHGEDKSNLFRSDKEGQVRTLSPLHIDQLSPRAMPPLCSFSFDSVSVLWPPPNSAK